MASFCVIGLDLSLEEAKLVSINMTGLQYFQYYSGFFHKRGRKTKMRRILRDPVRVAQTPRHNIIQIVV